MGRRGKNGGIFDGGYWEDLNPSKREISPSKDVVFFLIWDG
jgi:hypothetical protein